MNFLVDAQLPRRLAALLQQAGHNAIHTLDLAEGNRTPDVVINEIAELGGQGRLSRNRNCPPKSGISCSHPLCYPRHRNHTSTLCRPHQLPGNVYAHNRTLHSTPLLS
ncbi:MAG: DUF5615 family PIN-like protein [Chloroflexota bacterium]|nr:DUF5615 family PIN-like protein [Chloroflexota bacterium]